MNKNRYLIVALVLLTLIAFGSANRVLAAKKEKINKISLYTKGGIELRIDLRFYTMMAMFNAMGYDHETRWRQQPFKHLIMHGLRDVVRNSMARATFEEERFQQFLDNHQYEMKEYFLYLLYLNGPGDFAPSKKMPFDLRKKYRTSEENFADILKSFFQSSDLEKLVNDHDLQEWEKYEISQYLPHFDQPIKLLEDFLRLGTAETINTRKINVIFNYFDSHGTFFHQDIKDEIYFILGPQVKPAVDKIVFTYFQEAITGLLKGQENLMAIKAQKILKQRSKNIKGDQSGKYSSIYLKMLVKAIFLQITKGTAKLAREAYSKEETRLLKYFQDELLPQYTGQKLPFGKYVSEQFKSTLKN